MSAEVGPVYRDVNIVRTIADRRGDLEEWEPWYIAHNPVSGHILVTDSSPGGKCIRVFMDNPPYSYITQYGRYGEGEGEYILPRGITCDSDGRVIVADHDNDRLQVLSPTGQYQGQVTGLSGPVCVCVDGEDNMYVGNYDGSGIRVFNPQGKPLPTIREYDSLGDGGKITISGEHLYEVELVDRGTNPRQLHIRSLTDRSDVKSVALPQQIPEITDIHIIACRDGRVLITAWGWRASSDDDVIDEDLSYIHVLDCAGHNPTPGPYRYERGDPATTLIIYDNTLVVMDAERRLQLVTLPGLDPPLQPTHPVRVTSLNNLCLYKIRSTIRHSHDVHKLTEWLIPGLISKLMELYTQ